MPFKRLFGGGKESIRGEIDIEDYLNELTIREGKIIETEGVTYVKPVALTAEGKGIGQVIAELEKNNIVVLNVSALMHNRVLLKDIVHELRDACIEIDGDLGKISDEKILVVPNGMRIAHAGPPVAEAE
ncbi:MAG: cell division protein SepF [Candidatus Altiarchaeota archaeon]